MGWRLAKGAATRYLASEGASQVEAREVVRRYVGAMQETSVSQGRDLLAEFRLTRKVAQSLGEFGDLVAVSGLPVALEALGLSASPQDALEVAIHGLTSTWIEEDGGLEAAVVRTVLATCLRKVWASAQPMKSQVDGSSLVGSLLVMALCQRLALDLGESLEAAARGWPAYKKALITLEDELYAVTKAFSEDPPKEEQWQGLAGWLWVTRFLENVLQHFQKTKPS